MIFSNFQIKKRMKKYGNVIKFQFLTRIVVATVDPDSSCKNWRLYIKDKIQYQLIIWQYGKLTVVKRYEKLSQSNRLERVINYNDKGIGKIIKASILVEIMNCIFRNVFFYTFLFFFKEILMTKNFEKEPRANNIFSYPLNERFFFFVFQY